jgi:sec-independent protein translocase protein TatA
MVGLDNPLHIALVLLVVLMVFGAKRLPEMGKGLGEGMRGFKQAISGESHHEEPVVQVHEEPVLTPAPAAVPAPLTLAKVEESGPEHTSAPVA